MIKPYDLIGGHRHGKEVEVNDDSAQVDIVVLSESAEETCGPPETYIRRHLDGKEFSEGYECFAVSTDDDTETRALALLHLNS